MGDETKSGANEKPVAVRDTLEQALEAAERTFEGKPIGEEEGGEDEASVMSGHPATETKKEETSSGEAAPTPTETPTDEAQKTEAPTFKYKDQGEAEAAALEAQRKITQFATELQQTKDLLLRTLAEKSTQPGDTGDPGKKAEATTPAEFAKQRRRESLEEIEALDPDDDDYKEKVAEIQAKADGDILRRYDEEKVVKSRQEDQEQKSHQGTIDKAVAAMKEAGLDISPGSPDGIFFWALAQKAPMEQDGLPVNLDGQIKWTIDQVKTYKNLALEDYKTEEARRRAQKAQNQDEPLERGVSGPVVGDSVSGKPSGKGPVSLNSVVEEVVESRRI